MKIDFIIISSILVIICFLPFIIFPLIANKEKKNIINRFKEEAQKLGLNISYELLWNNNLAGVDVEKRQFLFVQKTEMNFEIRLINLIKMGDIKIRPQTHTYKIQGKPEEILTRIDLEIYEQNSLDFQVITLFDHDLNYNQEFELNNAQKLALELRKYLSTQPYLRRTA
ncbi:MULTISPECIES: hypothetical protein [Salegentibacter]|uniref:Uncharacterized protein n=1 Tax=Salegentibacter agarivorans TaxID=345907 RepID=A0A1I2Q471_9FLAO|nr:MULTISPECIES: hypothetical protein [Salegentibacter]SFG22159.1 hypothetical protein SAMN04488033_1406 [Salegentibacter agarivorans]